MFFWFAVILFQSIPPSLLPLFFQRRFSPPPPAVFFSISPLGHPFLSPWLTSILPLTPRGNNSLSHTIQGIPNPISLIIPHPFPTPQSCHPNRTSSNRLTNHNNNPLRLVLSPLMTNIPRSSRTSPPLQNPTNRAIPSHRLPFLQNSTRKYTLRVLAHTSVPVSTKISSLSQSSRTSRKPSHDSVGSSWGIHHRRKARTARPSCASFRVSSVSLRELLPTTERASDFLHLLLHTPSPHLPFCTL